MGRALRRHRSEGRSTDRIPFHALVHITTEDGKPAAPLARCTEIGLGGLRISAAEGLPPQTRVHISMRLSSGRLFTAAGHIAWSKQTIHPSLFGTPTGRDDDALFGIAFDNQSPEDLLPITGLFDARDRERQRARRIRRRNGLPTRT